MKKCTKCLIEKLPSQFLIDKRYNTQNAECRDCNSTRARQWRSTVKGQERSRFLKKRTVQREPANSKARRLVRDAIKNGKLKRLPCETCGAINTHAHHSDYNHPLQVIFLCAIHHREWHKNNKAIQITNSTQALSTKGENE